jgi:hypothetical protein
VCNKISCGGYIIILKQTVHVHTPDLFNEFKIEMVIIIKIKDTSWADPPSWFTHPNIVCNPGNVMSGPKKTRREVRT